MAQFDRHAVLKTRNAHRAISKRYEQQAIKFAAEWSRDGRLHTEAEEKWLQWMVDYSRFLRNFADRAEEVLEADHYD